MPRRLEGKVALITGSTSGIGRATAKVFAAEGAQVVLTGRRMDWGDSAISEIKSAGGTAVYYQADLGDSQAVRDLVRFTISSYGRLDVLMNNAYSHQEATLLDVTEASWDRFMAVMLKAPFIACQEAMPQMMRQANASIINISSVQGYLASDRCVVYDTAKGGLINFTRQLAVEYGPHGVRCNAICPGVIIVERSEARYRGKPLVEPGLALNAPLRRTGSPVDVAYAALYLASDESSFVTGTTLVVDGGETCQVSSSTIPRLTEFFRRAFAEEWSVEAES